jgi:hypothetical protein
MSKVILVHCEDTVLECPRAFLTAFSYASLPSTHVLRTMKEIRPTDFGLHWSQPDAIRYLLQAWCIDKRDLPARLAEALREPELCGVVHSAARDAALGLASWFLDAYASAIFQATVISPSLLEFQHAAGIPNALEKLAEENAALPSASVSASAIEGSMRYWLAKK